MLSIFNILKANEAVKALTLQVETMTADNKQLLEAIDGYKQKEAAFTLGSQDWAAEKELLIKGNEQALKDLDEKYTNEISELSKQNAETKVSVGEQAKVLVASLGIEPDAIKVSVVPSEVDITKKFQSLSGDEQHKFYLANKDLILAKLGLNK